MKHIKKFYVVAALVISTLAFRGTALPVQAYTEEEKQMAKNWLASHGYSPTMDGAYQAYQDYLDGKYDSSGNPIEQTEPQTGEPQTYAFDDNAGDGTDNGTGGQDGNGDGQKNSQSSQNQTETTQTETETETETETQSETQTETEKQSESETKDQTETETQSESQTEVKTAQSSMPDWGKAAAFGVTAVAAGGVVAAIKHGKKKKDQKDFKE